MGFIGWAGSFFILVGILLVSYKLRSGFLFGVIGNGLWGIKGVIINEWDLVSLEVIIVIFQAFAWWKWRH